ncbi:MAG: hypothetical protein ACM3NF_10175 [Gemmatimonadota bacterium]
MTRLPLSSGFSSSFRIRSSATTMTGVAFCRPPADSISTHARFPRLSAHTGTTRVTSPAAAAPDRTQAATIAPMTGGRALAWKVRASMPGIHAHFVPERHK